MKIRSTTHEFENEYEEIQSLISDITSLMMEQLDYKLWAFFEPYFREAGIKGKITRGKIKWRGIKLKVQHEFGISKYQLNQRGVDISPVFTIFAWQALKLPPKHYLK